MIRKVSLFIVLLLFCMVSFLAPVAVSAETLYEVGQTYTLYTAANYGTNKWASSDTSIVRIINTYGQYCTIECLRPGTAYVTIYVHYTKLLWDPVLKMFVNQPCVDKYYTYTIKVRTPQCILTNTALTKNTATFAFDAPTDASSVVMKQSSDNGVTWTNAATDTLYSTSTSAVVTGLQPNKKYAFKLSVTGGVRNGDSNAVEITTKANVSGVLLDKTELTIVRGGSGTLAAVVLPANAENKSVNWNISNSNLAAISVNDNGLATITANNTFNGTLTATATTVEGGYTSTCIVYIVDPPPKAPTNLRATEVGDVFIKLAWDASNTADYYNLYINSRKIGPITDTQYTIEDITPGGTNSYYIIACNEGGESPVSSILEVRQRNVKAVLSVESVTDTTITLKWNLGYDAQPYNVFKIIEYRAEGDFVFEKKSFISNSNIMTYSGFQPNTTYEIRAAYEYFESEVIIVKTYPLGIKEGTKTPRASVESGEVTKGTKVTLSTDTNGATIYYTTDGSAPTSSSALYKEPITITKNMTLKAIAVKSGLGDSFEAVYNYKVTQPPTYLDINKDGEVNMSDLTKLSTYYGLEESDAGYEVSSDFNGDGIIDIFDIVRISVVIN
jgi:hypothetical protein